MVEGQAFWWKWLLRNWGGYTGKVGGVVMTDRGWLHDMCDPIYKIDFMFPHDKICSIYAEMKTILKDNENQYYPTKSQT